jgi:hypothetical protein
MRSKKRRLLFIAPLAILGMLLFVAVGGALVVMLWNHLLPQLFGWPEISFWQALGLLALCRILFGGFGFRGYGRSGAWDRAGRRWEQMTPEERERFRQGARERWGAGSSPEAGEWQ